MRDSPDETTAPDTQQTDNNPTGQRRNDTLHERALEHLDLRSRPSTRHRALRLAGTVGVVLLALVLLLGVSTPLRAGLQAVFIPAPATTLTATSPILPGEDLFNFDPDIPWTTITLDGHPLQNALITYYEPPLRLARGQHHLTWTAPPFEPQTCIFSVPPQPGSDTCKLDLNSGVTAVGGMPPSVIQLRESFATLPPDQRSALLATMRHAVAGFSATVQPGENCLCPPQGATQPLRATLTFAPDISADGSTNLPCWLDSVPSDKCSLSGQDCAQICTIPWQSRHVAQASAWLALVPAFPTWTYSTMDRHVLSHGQTIDPGAAGGADVLTVFSITWDGAHWHTQPLFGPNAPAIQDDAGRPIIGAACAPGQDTLQDFFFFMSQVRYVEDTNPANGCLVVATINPAVTPPPQVQSLPHGATTAAFLVRFGALEPLDAAAHRLVPWPMAGPYVRSLASRLASQPGQICSNSGGGGC